MASLAELDAGPLVLRPIDRRTAAALLEGRTPAGLVVAQDYPSQFSLEVMGLVAGPRAAQTQHIGPFFLVRKSDATVVGEIGAFLDPSARTAQVGYSVVRSCWGRGYATEALRALLTELVTRADVRRVVAETMVTHGASRRVMEKAGMRQCGHRTGEEGGQPVDLVVYELTPSAPAG